ncbi:unnamed protein product [Meganyctiphanes norvegica]|uniref:Uncharacterized protein n=1 Tax=Meganyctiphanes norvegica TaxID=48144 RepID=A0AAV2QGP2_MEGNR
MPRTCRSADKYYKINFLSITMPIFKVHVTGHVQKCYIPWVLNIKSEFRQVRTVRYMIPLTSFRITRRTFSDNRINGRSVLWDPKSMAQLRSSVMETHMSR